MSNDDKAWVPWALAGCGLLLLIGFCTIAGTALLVVRGGPATDGPLAGDPNAPPPPGAWVVSAQVTSVTGSQPVPSGATCEFGVEQHNRPDGAGYWCRSQIACGGRMLYGGPRSGYYPCTLTDQGGRQVLGRDEQTTSQDTDAAIELDSIRGILNIRDDATGPYGAYVLSARVTQVR